MVSWEGTGDNGRDNRRADGRGWFQTRPYGAVHMVSVGRHAAPHGIAIGSAVGANHIRKPDQAKNHERDW